MPLAPVLARLDQDLDAALDRLMSLLRIPSISTDPAYKSDCDAAADWMVDDLATIGFNATKRPTPGHPMVVAHGGEGAPHLLFYGHYDVQPVDPLDLWDTPPFEPKVEDTPKGKVIRGRGAADDKGQLMTFVEAMRAWVAVHGKLPCKITIFLEGEEESGSPSLVPFMKENAEELTADMAMICDTGMFESSVPAITTQLRGMLTEELTIHAADRDLHSGMFGGLARNPIHVLTELLSTLHDAEAAVTLDGFYDGVPDLPETIRAQWQNLAFDHGSFLGDVGLSVPAGEIDRTPLEQLWARPTCEVNGIWGGYTGEGFKTVLPAQASAKISFRLVGTQDPEAIHSAFVKHVNAHLPGDVTAEFGKHRGSTASHMATDTPAFEQARGALSEEWGRPAAFIGCGGSIPIAGHFQEVLGMDSMLIGFGRDDDQIHSPNEKYDLESFSKGARSWARIFAALT